MEREEVFHQYEKIFGEIPGTLAVRLGPQRIAVYTTRPELIPADAEGVPVTVIGFEEKDSADK